LHRLCSLSRAQRLPGILGELDQRARVGKRDDKDQKYDDTQTMNFARSFTIDVTFHPALDDDPAGYVAGCEALGLVVEASTLDEISQKIGQVAPDLFDMNVRRALNESARALPPKFQLRTLLPACCHRAIIVISPASSKTRDALSFVKAKVTMRSGTARSQSATLLSMEGSGSGTPQMRT